MRQQITSVIEKLSFRTSLFVIFSLVILAALLFWVNWPEPDAETQLADLLQRANISQLDFGPTQDSAKVALGQAPFFDKELSGNRDTSCATCHHPLLFTGDGLPLPVGTGGAGLGPTRVRGEDRAFVPRNAPELFNRGAPEWRTMFWDGRIAIQNEYSLSTPAGSIPLDRIDNVTAAQALFPPTSPDEMLGYPGDKDVFGEPNELVWLHGPKAIWDGLITRLAAIPGYQPLFEAAFPDVPLDKLSFYDAANAIGAFEMAAFTFTDSPWDRYLAGETAVLSEEAKQGAALFYGEAGCVRCHSGNLMTDQQYHNIGVPSFGPGKDEVEVGVDDGRFRETHIPAHQFAFRTPPLRNIAITWPYMHNGAYDSLEDVVRHHLDVESGLRNYDMSHLVPELQITCRGDAATLDRILQTIDPLVAEPQLLSDSEVGQIIAFLHALTAPSATNLAHTIPDSVPSGLPVRD